jgi:hypothetical protein
MCNDFRYFGFITTDNLIIIECCFLKRNMLFSTVFSLVSFYGSHVYTTA